MRARAACPCVAELLASHLARVLVCSGRRFTCDAWKKARGKKNKNKNPAATIVSLDARSAYDVAFVRGLHARQSECFLYGMMMASATRLSNGMGGRSPGLSLAQGGPCLAWRQALRGQGFLVALGTPIESPEFVEACAAGRFHDSSILLDELSQLPDLQLAWLLFLFCAAPRSHVAYAEAHDQALWHTLQANLSPSSRRTGFGLLCARAAPAAY